MSHLVSQDNGELVNICNGVQHPCEHEHLPVLQKKEKENAIQNLSHVMFKDILTRVQNIRR